MKLVDSKSQKESLVWVLILDTTRLLHVVTIQQFKGKSDVIGMRSLFSKTYWLMLRLTECQT